DQVAQRFRASAALDRNDAIAPRQEAEERNIGELFLENDHRQLRQANHLERLEHRLVLNRDQMGTGRNVADHPYADPKQMLAKPMIEVDPVQYHSKGRPMSEQAGEHTAEDPEQ